MIDPGRPKALLLDVGGVLVLPRGDRIGGALAAAGVAHDPTRIDAAHYAGIAAIDDPHVEADQRSAAYRAAFVLTIGVQPGDRAVAEAILAIALREPDAWTRAAPGAEALLRACAAAKLPVAIVSNWDGKVARLLADAAICQAGAGPLASVAIVVDSAVVGWEKPDPRIFGAALAALGVSPADALHVGDSVRADVEGARAAGIGAIHLDPTRHCGDEGHQHASSLGDVGVRIGLGPAGAPEAVA